MRHKRLATRLDRLAAGTLAIILACGMHALVASAIPTKPGQSLHGPLEAKSSDDSCVSCYHDGKVIERWSRNYFPESYAGMYLARGRLMVGYTQEQGVRVRAARELVRLVAPKRIHPFPYVPKYSRQELHSLESRILDDVMINEAYEGLLVGVGVEIRRNRVNVGTERVRTAKKVLEELYGPDAPIFVRYEQPPVPLVTLR